MTAASAVRVVSIILLVAAVGCVSALGPATTTIYVDAGVGQDSTLTLGPVGRRITLHAQENELILTSNGNQVMKMTPLAQDSAAFTPAVTGGFEIGQITATNIFSDDFEIVNPEAPLQQWLITHIDTFSNGTDGWDSENGPALETSVCGGLSMIGGPCKTSHHVITKTYELPKHAQIQVTARVHFLDNWDDDTAFMKLSTAGGEVTAWTEQYTWCPQFFTMMCAKGNSACGKEEYPDRLSKLVSVTLPHQEPTLTIKFGTNIPEIVPPCEVSYGVSSVMIEVR